MRPVETADRATGSRRRRYEGGEWRRTLYRPTMGSHDEVSVRSEEEEDARARNASGGSAGAHRQRICDLGGDLDDADGGERDRRVLELPSGPAKDHRRYARPPRAARRRQRSRHVDIAPFLGSEDESEDNDGDGPKAKEKKAPEKNSVHILLSLQSHRRALQSAWLSHPGPVQA